MRWGEIETLMKGAFEVVVDVGAKNKYFIRKEEKMQPKFIQLNCGNFSRKT